MNNGWNKVIQHDCLQPFPLKDSCIDVVITSPPYWGLRDYGVDGQIGLEKHPSEYIQHLVDVAREVRRVLKKSGSFYLNLGDTYCGGGNWRSDKEGDKLLITGQNKDNGGRIDIVSKIAGSSNWLQPKQLMLIPSRTAIALQDDGWILRNDIIWHKPNPMPSSVKDRLNCTFEHVFHFVKNKKYYYNLDSIRVPHKSIDDLNKRKNKFWSLDIATGGSGKQNCGRSREEFYSKDGKNPGDVINQPYSVQPRNKEYVEIRDLPDIKIFSKWLNTWRKQQNLSIDKIESDMESQAPHHWFNGESYPSVDDWKLFRELYNPPTVYDKQLLDVSLKSSEKVNNPNGKNPGDIIYGDDLGNRGRVRNHLDMNGEHHYNDSGKNPGDVIKELQKKRGYKRSGMARIASHLFDDEMYHPKGRNPGDFWDINTKPFTSFNPELEHFAVFPEELIEKPLKASCPKDGIVLDCFCGRGTVGKVAKNLGLNYVLFDIKPEYVELARLYVNGQKRKLIEYQQKLDWNET